MTATPESLHIACPHCNAINRVPAEHLADGGNSHKNANCGKCKRTLFAGEPLELDESGFVIHSGRSDLPLVVDFWAPWCGPCRMMAPAFAEAARTLEPRYRLAKVNTEEQQGLAARFGIRSIPTLAIFKQGREVARQSGAMDAGRLAAWIRNNA